MKRTWSRIVLTLLALSGVSSTSAGSQSPATSRPAERAGSDTTRPVEIFNDDYSGLGAVRYVIRSRSVYDRMWEILRMAKEQPAPVVDFSKDMVILVGEGYQAGIGPGIRISSVVDSAAMLRIKVDVQVLGPRCAVGYAVVNHPAVMVRVPQSQSTAVFEDRVFPCGSSPLHPFGSNVPALPPDTGLPADIAAEIYARSNIINEDSAMTGPYPRDLIWLWFRDDASQAERQEAVAAINGEVVGGFRMRPGGVYYVRIKPVGPGARALHVAIARLKSFHQVTTATPDLNLATTPNSTRTH